MSKVKWSHAFTTDSPPIAPRRKAIRPEQKHSREEWDKWKPRIEELYQSLELTEVKKVLQAENFIASERQLRSRLETWGNKKFLKLSPGQWKYIEHEAVTRTLENPNKRNACRFKANGEKISSSKIQRRLDQSMSKRHFTDVLSVSGTVSSHGISVYTSNTKGFRLNVSRLKYDDWRSVGGSTRAETNNISTVPEDSATEPCGIHPISEHRGGPWPLPCDKFMGNNPMEVQKTSLEIFNSLSNNLRQKYPQDMFQSGQRLALPINYFYTCGDCPGYRFYLNIPIRGLIKTPEELEAMSSRVEKFEKFHLMTDKHRQRVNSRVIGNGEGWERRELFVAETGMTCPHKTPPLHELHEFKKCWSPGGCRWSQLKAQDEQKLMALFLREVSTDGEDADDVEGKDPGGKRTEEENIGDENLEEDEDGCTDIRNDLTSINDRLDNWLREIEDTADGRK